MHGQHMFLEPEVPKKGSKADARWKPEDVAAIYKLYPRHVGKPHAETAIRKALSRLAESQDDPVAWLMERVRLFARSRAGQSGPYCPYPATWMNQGRYEDDPTEWDRQKGSHVAASTDEDYDQDVRRY